MKRTIVTAALLMATFGTASADSKLRIATEGAFPPFNNVTASGELVGFDVEIAKAICSKMSRECDIVAQDWDGIIPGLINNKYDAIIASMSITDDRKQVIDFSNPYYRNYLSVVAKDGSAITLDNLAKQKIGAQRSSISSQWTEDNYGRRGDVNVYDSNPAAFSDLKAGRIDVVVVDFLVAAEWVGKTDGFGFAVERIDIGDQIGIGVRKGDSELRGDLNSALKSIREDGTYQKISNAYFGYDIF